MPDGVLAGLLRDRRHKLAVTQTTAASQIGTSQQLVANWESGSQPSNRYLAGIANFLGLDSVEALHATLTEASRTAPTETPSESALDRLTNSVATRLERGEPFSDEEARMVTNLLDSYRRNSARTRGE